MADRKIFISHVNEDAELAVSLKELIEDAFAGAFDVFVSSDRRSLGPSDDWLQKIEENLRQADDFIIILSPQALSRPWVNFEAGAAFAKDIRIFPLCVRGLSIDHVGPPLSRKQLLGLHRREDLGTLVKKIAEKYGSKPRVNRKLADVVVKLASPTDLPQPLTPGAKEKEPIILGKMREEWDALQTDRRTFWEVLAQYYAPHFRGTSGYPDTIEALVDLTPPPHGLPLPLDEHLRDYPSRYGRLLTGESALLHRFCNLVYPLKDPAHTLKECSSIPDDSFDAFHVARGNLAKFWNRWGEDVYFGGLIGLDTIVRSFDAHRRLLNLLTYLETSLTQWTQDPGVGKQWLFRLNRDWQRV